MRCNFKLESETATMPTMHTKKSAGIDFYSDEKVRIPPKESRKISLGVSWKPEGFKNVMLLIKSRSGLAFKKGVEASNAGIIDSDYFTTKGNKAIFKVKLYNNSNIAFYVNVGDKICQGIVVDLPEVEDVKTLDTDRGGKGFGSSDKK